MIRFLLVTPHPAMEQADPKLRKDLVLKVLGHAGRIFEVQFLRLLHQRIDDECLAALSHLLLYDSVNLLSLPIPERPWSPRALLPGGISSITETSRSP